MKAREKVLFIATPQNFGSCFIFIALNLKKNRYIWEFVKVSKIENNGFSLLFKFIFDVRNIRKNVKHYQNFQKWFTLWTNVIFVPWNETFLNQHMRTTMSRGHTNFILTSNKIVRCWHAQSATIKSNIFAFQSFDQMYNMLFWVCSLEINVLIVVYAGTVESCALLRLESEVRLTWYCGG